MKRLLLFLAFAGIASAQCSVYFDPLLRKLACAPSSGGVVEVARGAICTVAGCASETSLSALVMNGSGTLTKWAFNLLTKPTGSTVTVALYKNGVSVATLSITTAATAPNGAYVSSATISVAYVDGDVLTWAITANDSNNIAQNGTVQIWR